MPRPYPLFEELKESVAQKYRAYNLIGEENLNERGRAEYRAYRIIHDQFSFCLAKGELVECIRQEIAGLKAELQKIPTGDLIHGEWREDVAVIGLLRRYIRFNCSSNLWKDIPEFHTPTD